MRRFALITVTALLTLALGIGTLTQGHYHIPDSLASNILEIRQPTFTESVVPITCRRWIIGHPA
jgi:hypothetical protein